MPSYGLQIYEIPFLFFMFVSKGLKHLVSCTFLRIGIMNGRIKTPEAHRELAISGSHYTAMNATFLLMLTRTML